MKTKTIYFKGGSLNGKSVQVSARDYEYYEVTDDSKKKPEVYRYKGENMPHGSQIYEIEAPRLPEERR